MAPMLLQGQMRKLNTTHGIEHLMQRAEAIAHNVNPYPKHWAARFDALIADSVRHDAEELIESDAHGQDRPSGKQGSESPESHK